jgi:crotonobetainyl-CoA:carnitine CoA-transferase CaiB-like acyl-CoA transferase
VVGPVYGAADIVADPHYQAREDIIEIDDAELGHTRMLGIVPKFSDTPGAVEHAGPTVGQHNAAIYGSWLGLEQPDLDELKERGII